MSRHVAEGFFERLVDQSESALGGCDVLFLHVAVFLAAPRDGCSNGSDRCSAAVWPEFAEARFYLVPESHSHFKHASCKTGVEGHPDDEFGGSVADGSSGKWVTP
ncbi:MAG: hypothetical protein QNL12_10165 [Acidimicrobiia bacterium]|nr:hypothetical protein [Acidimicrobiia bacterium]MDX2467669.1 hypothetical protein [Acidimicrobiia bacterium]